MANYYVTVAGAGDNSGDSWANAMDLAAFKTYIEGTPTAGDIFYFAGGTYNLSSAIKAAVAGTITAPFKIIGVNAGTTNEPPVSSDYATGTDRPLLACGAYALTLNQNFFEVYNIRVTATSTTYPYYALEVGSYAKVSNVSVQQDSSNGASKALGASQNSVITDCEFVCTNGIALSAGTDSLAVGCYIHDSLYGLANNGGIVYISCIFDTLTQAYSMSTNYAKSFINCTFYNCTTGIYMSSTLNTQLFLLNNTFSDCACAFKGNYSGTPQPGYICSRNNNWYNNTIDISWDNGSTEDNSLKSPDDVSVDPQFTDAANGDFSLSSSSGLIGAGFGIELGVG